MNPKVSPKSDDPIVNERQALELQLQEVATMPTWRSGWRGMAIGIGIGVVVAGLGSSLSRSEPPSPPAAVVSEVMPSQTVTVAEVQRQRVTQYLEATGSVAAFDLLPILPQESGLQIVEVLVDEGDYVEAGQVLALLDGSTLEAQLDGVQAETRSSASGIDRARADAMQSEAGVRQAEADLARSQTGVTQAQANADRAQASIAQAEARLEQAEREYDRFRRLAEEGAISQQEADFRYTDVLTAREDYNKAIEEAKVAEANIAAAQADVGSAQARLVSSRATVAAASANIDTAIAAQEGAGSKVRQVTTQLDRTAIVAPQGGLIVTRNARVGDVKSSMSSAPLFEIVAGGRLELQVKVPETQLAGIVAGSTVKVRSDADNRIQVQGVVRTIAPKIDATTREAIVEIDLPASNLLRPGMFLRASIATGVQQGLTIPAKAVLPQGDGQMIVYTVNADYVVTAKPVKVGTLTDNGQAFEIRSGLEAGDRVVVNGAGYVKDGDTVRVVQ
jgi:RND family efflux transporter MFP subunit